MEFLHALDLTACLPRWALVSLSVEQHGVAGEEWGGMD